MMLLIWRHSLAQLHEAFVTKFDGASVQQRRSTGYWMQMLCAWILHYNIEESAQLWQSSSGTEPTVSTQERYVQGNSTMYHSFQSNFSPSTWHSESKSNANSWLVIFQRHLSLWFSYRSNAHIPGSKPLKNKKKRRERKNENLPMRMASICWVLEHSIYNQVSLL